MVEVIIIGIFVAILLIGLALPDRPIPKCRRKDCNLGPGWHVHSPEGRSYMTPEQQRAMRESLQRARKYHEEKNS